MIIIMIAINFSDWNEKGQEYSPNNDNTGFRYGVKNKTCFDYH